MCTTISKVCDKEEILPLPAVYHNGQVLSKPWWENTSEVEYYTPLPTTFFIVQHIYVLVCVSQAQVYNITRLCDCQHKIAQKCYFVNVAQKYLTRL